MKRFLNSAAVQAMIVWLGYAYLMLVARTTRWEVQGRDHLDSFASGRPCIVAFWHETLPAMPILWMKKTAISAKKPAFVLASRHRDGQLIGKVVEKFGPAQVAASSSKGGAAGLRALARALAGGADVGLTPDGPRGPRRVAAPGVAQLAALTEAPVLAAAAATAWGIKLNTWDGMKIPLPFGRGRLVIAAPISVLRHAGAARLPEIEAALNLALERARAS
jgi:lysophospholipid acyltransferase (LPLAT)-like uncharacterized protein